MGDGSDGVKREKIGGVDISSLYTLWIGFGGFDM